MFSFIHLALLVFSVILNSFNVHLVTYGGLVHNCSCVKEVRADCVQSLCMCNGGVRRRSHILCCHADDVIILLSVMKLFRDEVVKRRMPTL